MSNSVTKSNWELKLTLFLVVLAILADLISIFLGVAWGNGGYLEKLNWSLYPIFFVITGLLVYTSWRLYMDAWKSLSEHNVLYAADILESDNTVLAPLLNRISSHRKYLIIISVFLGTLITVIDAGCLWSEYEVISSAAQCEERDFSVAFAMKDIFSSVDKTANGLFNIFVYSLQAALISTAWLALSQITLHGFYFWKLESRKEAINRNLNIKLNINDPLHEFGITELNRALNTMYIAIALAMVIPMLSAASQETNDPDFGQWLLRGLLPLLMLAPLVIPFIDRYFRLKEASKRVLASSNEKDATDFSQQKLWPFEGTQIGYLGKIAFAIVLAEYVYLFTLNFIGLIG